MENQTTENNKPLTFKEQIFEGFKVIASICIVGGLLYVAFYYNETKPQMSEEQVKLQFYQKQSEALQKHIATNDSILFHLINENKTLRSRYDSIVSLSHNDSPEFLPLFSK